MTGLKDKIKNFFSRAKDLNSISDSIRQAYYVETGNEYFWLEGLYYENGKPFAIIASDGKLVKAEYSVDTSDNVKITSMQDVEITFIATPSQRMSVKRINDKTAIFYGIVASAVLNRGAEIDTKDLFDDFEQNYVNGEAYVTLQHLPEKPFAFGTVNGVFRYKEFLIAYGTLDLTTKLGRAAESKLPTGEYGFSIGFYAHEIEYARVNGVTNIPLLKKGRLIEISILRETSAASYFTKAYYKKVDREMEKNKAEKVLMDFLEDEDAAKEILSEADSLSREIKEKGMIVRENTENTEEAKDEVAVVEDAVVADESEKLVKLINETIETKFAELMNRQLEKFTEIEEKVARAVKEKEVDINRPSIQKEDNKGVLRPTQRNTAGKVTLSVIERITENLESTKIKK